MTSPPVTAILWDADGVLQQVPASWFELLTDIVGNDDAVALLDVLLPQMDQCLRGETLMSTLLPAALADRGLGDAVEKVSEVWGTIEVLPDSRDLVRRLRTAGIPGHLATNQDDLRTSYMRDRMGYDDLLDSCFYSCEVGAAKPDPEFFRHVAATITTEIDELVFVDDNEENVESARAIGLRSVLWHHRDGIDRLTERLAATGVEDG